MIKFKEKNLFVSIVVVNWNGKKWLKKCIDSLISQTYKNFEIIIVDNNSDDGSVDFLKSNYEAEKIRIIQNRENQGFGRANNTGVKNSKGDIVFFLNNDTQCSSDLLEKLVEFKINNKINIVGPRVLNSDGIDLLRGRYLGIDFLGSPGPSRKLFYIDGCLLVIGKDDFMKLGGFDKEYFMYSEDIDLCWRATLMGMKMGICENAKVVHFGGGSSEKTNSSKKITHIVPVWRRYEVDKNTLRSLLKNYRVTNLLWTVPFFILQNFTESIIYLITGNFKMFKSIHRAISWNVANIRDTINQRRFIQKNRISGDSEILFSASFIPNKVRAFIKIGVPKFK